MATGVDVLGGVETEEATRKDNHALIFLLGVHVIHD